MEPQRIELEVDCPPDQAFRLWAVDTSLWWPPSESGSGEPGVVVVFESRVGGRVFERTPAGIEHDWGEVTAWEPPRRLAWRTGAGEAEATFEPGEAGGTRLTLVAAGERDWEAVLELYRDACAD